MLAATVMVLVAAARPKPAPPASATPSSPDGSDSAESLRRFPPVVLWLWQRPEDVSFIDPRRIGVAYLAETLHLAGKSVAMEPNLNGFRAPSGTWLMASARIEVDGGEVPALSQDQAREAATRLAALGRMPGVKAMQVDFDATVAQRNLYRQLLVELRRELSPALPLSITALASWCVGDDWISQLPVSEAVPMLFRMGPDRDAILLRLRAGDDFPERLCRSSAGISTDEAAPHVPPGRRLYIFNPHGWTKESFERVMAEVKR